MIQHLKVSSIQATSDNIFQMNLHRLRISMDTDRPSHAESGGIDEPKIHFLWIKMPLPARPSNRCTFVQPLAQTQPSQNESRYCQILYPAPASWYPLSLSSTNESKSPISSWLFHHHRPTIACHWQWFCHALTQVVDDSGAYQHNVRRD